MAENENLAKDYKLTLNLPQTDFPMRGSLPQREPNQIRWWMENRIYARMLEKNKNRNAPRFTLHDGPPYANGNIHMGTSLNKVLKDVLVKYKNMAGFYSEYVPGWDCHGLPIELGVEKQMIEQKRDKKAVPVTELRQLCREYAQKFIQIQMEQFQRLEVFGDWENRYATMDASYVATTLTELGRCAESGVLYKANKPIYWCPQCTTALAEAEIEYAEKESPSITVKFDLTQEALAQFSELKAVAQKEGAHRVSLLIWTTTPWTLPANLGIALHPDLEYVAIKVPSIEGTEIWLMAEALQEEIEKSIGFEKKSAPLLTFKASRLERQKAKHPFVDRESLIMTDDFVTADAGTGAVHIAPGHGADDYRVGKKYGLEPLTPVDDRGLFTEAFFPMKGQFVFKANEGIISLLEESTHLVSRKAIRHSYPHCWRCHKAIIFRATAQWFISMEPRPGITRSLRKECVEATQKVQWIPEWGINRMLGMIEGRPDWCISRQRAWGVPIPAFYCASCHEPHAGPKIFYHIADEVKKRGTEVWFTDPVEKLLPDGSRCSHCGSTDFKKERDILDVWFESGISHSAVCETKGLGWPADLYLEGSDQHRGWFQTSLLTAVATRKQPPYKAVLTHGFVIDKDRQKMSKSLGNVVSPLDVIKNYGAENLRLWAIFEDFQNDVYFSKESLEKVLEAYKKIRNTFKFLLGNLYDFRPEEHSVPLEKMGDLDRWILSRAAEVIEKVQQGYENYSFYQVYHQVLNFCGVDLSALYLDILKDRLYTAGAQSQERRSSQSAIFELTRALAQVLAPILSFTAEEVWSHLPGYAAKGHSVFLEDFPRIDREMKAWRNVDLEARFAEVWKTRDAVLKELEQARQSKLIGHAREAKVTLQLEPASIEALGKVREDMSRLFLVSELEVKSSKSVSVQVSRVDGKKCARCWVYTKTVGKMEQYPDLCDRCVEALG